MYEIWKTIEEFPDYKVSNLGRIKSFKINKTDGEILKLRKNNKNGYFYITLCKKNKHENRKIHSLVYETFNNYKLKTSEHVHHIDENKKHNYLDNLCKMNKFKHNSLHSEKENNPMYGKIHSEKSKKLMRENHFDVGGINNPRSKLTEENIFEIFNDLNEGLLNQKEIAKKFNVSQTQIYRIKTGKSWNCINLKGELNV